MKQIDRLKPEIEKRAKLFVEDNISLPLRSDYLMVEAAMLIGASIFNELELAELKEEMNHE